MFIPDHIICGLLLWAVLLSLLGYRVGKQDGYRRGKSDGYDAGIVDAQINAWKKDCARRNRAGQFTSKK